MRVLLFTHENGNLAVTTYLTKEQFTQKKYRFFVDGVEVKDFTDEQYEQYVIFASRPKYKDGSFKNIFNIRFIDDSELPASQYFRDCWRDDGENVTVDMPLARELHLNKLRVIRNDKLRLQDIEFQKALEADDAQKRAEVVAKKQALRDMPVNVQNDLDSISDPNVLERYMPDVLKN